MRILFLDIDGVLVPGGFLRGCAAMAGKLGQPVDRDLLDPYKVHLLNGLKDVPGINLVISSTWRKHDNMPAAIMCQEIELPLHPDWTTTWDVPLREPGQERALVRGWQIAEWLSRHPETEGYAILDDDIADMLPCQTPHIVRTSYEEGLVPSQVAALRKALMLPAA